MTLIAIHLLQNHAPSNLNRDENNEPKDCLFGGARRARISSQAIKHSIRTSTEFARLLAPELKAERTELGQRTQWMPERVRELVQTSYSDLSAADQELIVRQAERLGTSTEGQDDAGGDSVDDTEGAPKITNRSGRSTNVPTVADGIDINAKQKTKQLMFLSAREIERLTDELYKLRGKTRERKKKVVPFGYWTGDEVRKEIGEWIETHALDIAMFGRMTTSSPFKDVDAAVQVAHAFSTHKIEPEFDFYTAMEDRPEPDATGASFLGDTAFNSATYYKYINIHWEGLLLNLGDKGQHELTALAVKALLRAAMTAIPTGKQNAFAAHNLPDIALVEVLEQNIPLSYANAFLKPVRSQDDESLMDASAAALITYAGPLSACYKMPVQRALFATPLVALPSLDGLAAQFCKDTDELEEWLKAHIPTAPEV